jgi:hypothetical protein
MQKVSRLYPAKVLHAGLQALQTKKGLKEGFAYLFTFSNILNVEILISIFI